MRLIDADAMLKRNENSIYDTTDLKEMLDNEPTADIEEVCEYENPITDCMCCEHHKSYRYAEGLTHKHYYCELGRKEMPYKWWEKEKLHAK